MSEANSGFSVFWDHGTVRTNPPSAAALTTGKTVAEDTDIIRVNDETVGIIVFEAGHGTIGGVEYEAALGADTIQGVTDSSPPYIYTFNNTFVTGSPTVALTTMAGMDGINGGWAQVHGATLADTTRLSIDEDQILDPERDHTPEQVAYVVFAGSALFPSCTEDLDCDDFLDCTGVESCVNNACQTTGDPCPGQICDENIGCVDCQNDGDCDDGLFCTGDETCVNDLCVTDPRDCVDIHACTVDSCNENTDQCDNVPNDAVCDNGLFCDGDETCSASVGCLAGADPCSGQECDEGNDTCGACVNAGQCDDGLVCTGVETCVDNACVAGTPVVCNDNVACTVDSCDEPGGECLFVPDDDSCDNGVFCDGAETCNVNSDCQAPSGVACPGRSCDEVDDFCSGEGKMEWGSVDVGGSPVNVLLTNDYDSPVIVATMQYSNSTTPAVTRITSVIPGPGGSFDVYLQNPSGLTPATENVSYLVVEKGSWTIDGVAVEAQTYNSTVTDEDGSWVGEVQSYLQGYTNPVVLGQVMSTSLIDPDFSVFWDQGSVRTNPPSAAALTTGKTVAEDSDVTRANETVGIIVFEAGHGTIGGVEYEAALGADTIEGVSDVSPPYIYTFNNTFATGSPTVALATMAGMDGLNGGWAQVHGATLADTTRLYLSIDEDQILDAERKHTPEQVAYVVFRAPGLFEYVP